MGKLEDMEAQINDIATSVGHALLNPLAVSMAVAVALALVTGVASRAAIIVENLSYDRIQRRRGSVSPRTGAVHQTHNNECPAS